ncbi:hypothetical protein K435DRAFT_724740 [Dendrothele bispora CBS 962.96]|uniref:AFG1-like ATPase n=1 Tax=Dendrothele bispora (strain CBS 962.96) TaxID=1314807 RepID=A0A4S8LX07_DENBC|nr:hypothetical protein K435DRAFT_724740 [Dendrothele bispora CBS 962.96]
MNATIRRCQSWQTRRCYIFTSNGPRIPTNDHYNKSTTRRLSSVSSSALPQQVDLLERYRGLVALKRVQYDEAQVRVIMQLRRLQRELRDYNPVNSSSYAYWHSPQDSSPENINEHPQSTWWSTPNEAESLPFSIIRFKGHAEELASLTSPKGLLLTGPPGSGKTFIVDLWYSALPTPYKTRKHYNELVLEIYRAVWEITQQRMASLSLEQNVTSSSSSKGSSSLWNASASSEWRRLWQKVASRTRYKDPPMAYAVAQRLIRHHWLLVFDEIQLLDVSSASLLADVLSWFWRMGGVVVGTSNKVPEDLYMNGVQRDRLEPFVEALKARCPVFPMDVEEERDWRLVKAGTPVLEGEKTWYVTGEEGAFGRMLSKVLIDPRPSEVLVFGRNLAIPSSSSGACRYAFHQLCDEELGPADYLTLASTFHTMILDQVPVLKLTDKDKARRFISLIDALYEARCKIIVMAEAEPEGTFFPDATPTALGSRSSRQNGIDIMMAESVGETRDSYRPNVSSYDAPNMEEAPMEKVMPLDTLSIFSGKDEQFAFKRALSRLVEMTSPTYQRDEVWTPLPLSSRRWETTSKNAHVTRATGAGKLSRSTKSNDDFAEEAAYEGGEKYLRNIPPELRPAPRLREHHVWGVRDNWGEGAGRWGEGAKAYEKSSGAKS